MNPIKEYFNYFTKKYDIDWKFEIFRWSMSIGLVCMMVGGIYLLDRCSKQEYENTYYQFEVIDKYDCLGSNWHLIGGRATEQEYHIIYKVTPLSESCDKIYLGEVDDEVSYKTYRKIKVGDKWKGHSGMPGMYNN